MNISPPLAASSPLDKKDPATTMAKVAQQYGYTPKKLFEIGFVPTDDEATYICRICDTALSRGNGYGNLSGHFMRHKDWPDHAKELENALPESALTASRSSKRSSSPWKDVDPKQFGFTHKKLFEIGFDPTDEEAMYKCRICKNVRARGNGYGNLSKHFMRHNDWVEFAKALDTEHETDDEEPPTTIEMVVEKPPTSDVTDVDQAVVSSEAEEEKGPVPSEAEVEQTSAPTPPPRRRGRPPLSSVRSPTVNDRPAEQDEHNESNGNPTTSTNEPSIAQATTPESTTQRPVRPTSTYKKRRDREHASVIETLCEFGQQVVQLERERLALKQRQFEFEMLTRKEEMEFRREEAEQRRQEFELKFQTLQARYELDKASFEAKYKHHE